MRTRKLVLASLFVAAALGLYGLECAIPPIVPVPGVKPGIANIVTLVCIYLLGKKEAFAVLMLRIFLSSILFGQAMSLTFSLAGGLLSFSVMCLLSKYMSEDNMWAVSVFAAFAHNLGQIAVAILITGQIAVAYYFLFLVISSVITGCFNGICALYSVRIMKNSQLLK